jgi:hypothetical protein
VICNEEGDLFTKKVVREEGCSRRRLSARKKAIYEERR